MKMLNSKQMCIPDLLTQDEKLTGDDVLCYCKVKRCFDSRRDIKNYPVELLFLDTKMEWGLFSQCLRNLESRGFLLLDRENKTVTMADYAYLYSPGGKNKSLYIGRFCDGVCKVGITQNPSEREKQLSQYGSVFTMEFVYTFENGGLAGHLERMIKWQIPMMDLRISGGTECFESKYFEKAVGIVDGFLSSVYCGEVTVVQKEREVGSL